MEYKFNEINSKYNIMLPDYEEMKQNYEKYIKENGELKGKFQYLYNKQRIEK